MLKRKAFTLIELLVVVTIIVVLVAMLVPAMEGAVYQAQMASCSSNLHQIAPGVIAYTQDYGSRYPHRAGVHFQADWNAWYVHQIAGPGFDDRPLLRPYIFLNGLLNDPLTPGPVDLEKTPSSSFVFSAYNLWFGWQFRHGNGGAEEGGSLRYGDRVTWSDADGERELNILAGDRDRRIPPDRGAASLSNHRDHTGSMMANLLEDPTYTFSRWQHYTAQRGPIDLNLLFTDGSVHRANDLTSDDDRLIRVPDRADGLWLEQWWNFVPRH